MKSETYKDCIRRIKKHGERFPKKHGEWYRIKAQNKWILLDTWNSAIFLMKECSPSGKDANGGIVCFYGDKDPLAIDFGRTNESARLNYWRCHLPG
jgi:hypothetical protein